MDCTSYIRRGPHGYDDGSAKGRPRGHARPGLELREQCLQPRRTSRSSAPDLLRSFEVSEKPASAHHDGLARFSVPGIRHGPARLPWGCS